MRFAVLAALAACGGSSPAPVANAGTESAVAVPALQPGPACEARMDTPDGLHDRFMFTDEATEKAGYKDKAGTLVIPAIYHAVYPFSPGGVAAVIDGTTPFVFIDVTGKLIAKAYAFDNGPDYYQEGFARVVGTDGRIGYISETTGKISIAAQFETAMPFCEGKAEVKAGGQTYSIDTLGKRVP